MLKKILITGSSGFIGSHLSHHLSLSGYDVLGLDIRASSLCTTTVRQIACDILDGHKLNTVFRDYMPDAVIHLAARTDLEEKNNIEGYAANIQGTENLIRAIKEVGSVRRALFTSSQLVCKVGYIPASDTDYQPGNLYGESKVLTERIVHRSDLSGVSWCLLRPTTIWGEGMSEHYQRFLGMVKKNQFIHIGNGPLLKSYGYIGNTIYQYGRFLEAPHSSIHGRTFYIADYVPLSLRGWVDDLAVEFGAGKVKSMPIPVARVAALFGDLFNFLGINRFPFNSFRLKNVLTEYMFDLSTTEEVCGPLPFSVKEGVARTSKWFEGKLNSRMYEKC